ncbi:MAG: 16S rRNA (cytosine(1402)-N(4))-methyltransferase RsmH [Planctomycetes bacterium]|nr:16S rRNA (cytosine(1402)-N(4))-methyltransferase RsmH [Planctomycetota bacterium]
MAESDPNAEHRRRPRYRGTHPRRFEQKYKELAPDKYPELVEHVRARGMTPAGQHVPILVDEVLAVLAPKPGERGVDCTLGFGGHARAFLERIAPDGALLGLDVDPDELAKTEARLRALGHGPTALFVERTNFAGLGAALGKVGWHDGVDFVLADLGVSSMQIDDPWRGFGFKVDGPLDMRMNPTKGVSAADWLARTSAEELERVLVENSDEPHAQRIALALDDRRPTLATTLDLADAVRGALPSRLEPDDVQQSLRRVFQALRIEVNDEFRVLEALLRQLPSCVRAGGRVAFLTFHSGEDRRVKHALAAGLRDGVWAHVCAEVGRASSEERRANPRAAPAKLRWARRA